MRSFAWSGHAVSRVAKWVTPRDGTAHAELARSGPSMQPPPSAATLNHGCYVLVRATSWHLFSSLSSSSTTISIGGSAGKALAGKPRKTRVKPPIWRCAKKRERAKRVADRRSLFQFAGDDERCRADADVSNVDRLLGVEVTAYRAVNRASMSTSANGVGAVLLE